MAITAQVDGSLGLGGDILAAVEQVRTNLATLKSMDALRIHTTVARMKRMRNPDNNDSSANYAEIAVAAGVQGADAAAKNASAQEMYMEMEALSGHYNNASATVGTLTDQGTKVIGIVGPK
jgi:hypothetical protein